MRKHTIAHLVSALDGGGTERLLLAMAPLWDSSRFTVELWCLNIGNIPSYLQALESDGVKVRMLGQVKREKVEPAVVWQVVRTMVHEGVSVIHSHTPYALAVSVLARTVVGSRVIHVHHQHSLPSRVQVHVMRWLARITPPDVVVAVSEWVAAKTRELAPGLRSPSVVINNGIRLPPCQGEKSCRQPARILTSARLSAEKNVDLLLVAMRKVMEKSPSATLTVLGDGELRTPLEQRAALLGIKERTNFTGWVLEPEIHYRQCDIFALASLSEGFGLSLLEAMALAKPCVATAVGAIPELLSNERNGLTVPPNDPDAMAEAILRIIDDPPLGERLGYEARRKAEEFDIGKTVDRIEKLYLDCIHAKDLPNQRRTQHKEPTTW